MDFLVTIFFFVLIIGILVLVHELGHFLAAKAAGVEVKEFAIGFGKTLFAKEYKGTRYCINLLPLGGYVNLEGETSKTSKNAFRNKKFRIKLFVLVAGVAMNLLLAFILLTVYLASNGYKFSIFPNIVSYNFSGTETNLSYLPLRIVEVNPKGVSAGKLKADDIIVTINDKSFKSFGEFKQILEENLNSAITIGILDLETYSVSNVDILLKEKEANGGILNVTFSADNTSIGRQIYFLSYPKSILSGFYLTFDSVFYQFKAIGEIIGNAVSSGNYTELGDTFGGLPAVSNQISQIVEFRVLEILIPLSALISISLAIINILPFPALDGGQILVFAIEKLRGKELSEKLLNRINLTGFAILIIFAIAVNVKDVIQLNWAQGFLELVRDILGR